MFLTIVVFIIILGLIIFVHELGHFVMAKRAGIKIEEFGFGYPPRLFGIKRGETIYSLNLLPIGGFVKIHGEDGKKKDDQDKARAFYSKSIGARAKILVAGVTMNLILAAFLLAVGFMIGLPSIIDDQESGILKDPRVQITQVDFDTPAAQTGIKTGDTIKELRFGQQVLVVNKVEQVQNFINQYQGGEITVIIERGDQILEKKAVPRTSYPDNQGPLGIGLARTATVAYPWYQAIAKGVVSTVNLTLAIIVAFAGIIWQLITMGQAPIQIAGPVGIFDLAGQATRLGFIYILQFTAILNINLAILNVLPFPALDGGRLLFLGIEKIKGSPVSQKIEGFAHTAGFIILILLMIAVTWRDIVRVF
ncbi:MAG: site-2 protease family protein [Patescibacteria group bacterium]